jgi:hypothetical protein
MRDELKAWIDQAKSLVNNLVYEVAEFHDCGDEDATQVVRCERALDKHFAALAVLDAQQLPDIRAFFDKHALGTLTAPSCFGCGAAWKSWDGCTRHLELMGIYLCAECAGNIAQQPQEETPTETMNRWLSAFNTAEVPLSCGTRAALEIRLCAVMENERWRASMLKTAYETEIAMLKEKLAAPPTQEGYVLLPPEKRENLLYYLQDAANSICGQTGATDHQDALNELYGILTAAPTAAGARTAGEGK